MVCYQSSSACKEGKPEFGWKVVQEVTGRLIQFGSLKQKLISLSIGGFRIEIVLPSNWIKKELTPIYKGVTYTSFRSWFNF